MTQVYDSHTHKNFLAVLDAEHLADGPLALIHHTHHLPFGLHGWWSGISCLKCFSQSTVVKKGTVDKSQFVCPSGASAGCQPILDELYARQLAEAEN